MKNSDEKMVLLEEDNGFCRVYYYHIIGGKHRLLCYQSSISNTFALYECTPDGEPSHSIPYQPYLNFTPLPEGLTETGRDLKNWLIELTKNDSQPD